MVKKIKKWLVHNDYEPLGVYFCESKEDAINRFKTDANKDNIAYDNKNIDAELMV
ncbi:MAG: hypothetical protein ACRCX2_28005 [Paraclostridium sp.]